MEKEQPHSRKQINDETLILLKDCTEIAARNPDVARMSLTADNQHGTNNVYHVGQSIYVDLYNTHMSYIVIGRQPVTNVKY